MASKATNYPLGLRRRLSLAIHQSASNIAGMSLSTSLRRAAKLQEKIEELREQLAGLLDKARAELDSMTSEEVSTSPRRGGEQKTNKRTGSTKAARSARSGHGPQVGKVDGRTKAARELKAKRRSPLAGLKRASSPSGPLAPAVVKVLEQKNKPMSVRDILDHLLSNGYTFNTSEPKKNLAARIYRLKGVRQVSPGLFAQA